MVFPAQLIKLVAVLGLIFILWMGLKPEPIPQYVNHFDKYTHLVGFAGLTLVWLLAFGRAAWLPIGAIMLLVGAGIEVYQGLWLPGRSFDIGDFIMNAIGVALACLLVRIRWKNP